MSTKKYLQYIITLLLLVVAIAFYAQQSFSIDIAQSTVGFSPIDDTLSNNQQRADSLASYRTYIKSKRYNDSIDQWRKARMDSIKAENNRKIDSTRAAKQRIIDSATAERKRQNDSLQAAIEIKKQEQQRHIDSLNAARQIVIDSLDQLKKYRTSKEYKDSVQSAQQRVMDSIKAVKQLYMDSLRTAREAQIDSLKIQKQQRTDSMMARIDSLKIDREKRIDSLKIVQQARVDSMEKLKEAREDALIAKEKEQKDKKKQKIEEKIEKERAAYTNEKMRKKKWSLLRQVVQNTTTRYNYFFNANNKIKEAEDNMYSSKTDNLDSLLSLYPYDPNTDAAKFTNDMDSLIKRISVGIQIHDPRSRWQDDLYLLLGKSFFYKKDYTNAAAAFQYIIASANEEEKKQTNNSSSKKDKDKKTTKDIVIEDKKGLFPHQAAKNEALLWLARVYTYDKDYGQAQLLLDMVQNSKNLSDRLQGELENAYATFYLAQGMNSQALPYLDSMTQRKEIDKRLRQRAGFLAGQLYQQNGSTSNSSRMYTKVLDLNPPIEMTFKATLNNLLAQSNSNQSNADAIIKTLNRMSSETKFKPYYDQIFYGLGKVHLGKGDNKEAIENFQKSTISSVNNKKQKGLSFYEMADIYYNSNQYVQAKNTYDSALTYLTVDDAPMYAVASLRANNLATIATPAAKVQYIDSLLHLSSLSDKEKRAIARDAIQKLKESASKSSTSTPAPTIAVTGGDWYFANEGIAAKGEAEFKSKWGNRPLKDNWRRSVGAFDTDMGAEDIETITDISLTEDDLIALIPTNPKVIDSFRNQLKQAYFLLGRAFFNAEDYTNATITYDTLLQRFPTFEQKAAVYYDLYIIALRNNNATLAAQYKSKLTNDYSDSEQAKMILNEQPKNNAKESEEAINEHLDQTYTMLQNGLFADVVVRTEEVKTLYPIQSPRYMNKYVLMKAIAFAGLGNYSKADSMLNEIIAINANDTLTEWARNVHAYIKANMPIVDTKPTTEATSLLDPTIASKEYEYNKDDIHFLMAITTRYDGRFKGLRSGITDYNSIKRTDLSLSSSLSELDKNQAIFVFKDFDNSTLAKNYLLEIKKEKELVSAYPNPTEITFVIISENNYNLFLAQKNIENYLKFYYKNYK